MLNEMAKEKRSELRGMVSEKYSHSKDALGGTAEEAEGYARKAYAKGEAQEIGHRGSWGVSGGKLSSG
jgi:hypothetical protein